MTMRSLLKTVSMICLLISPLACFGAISPVSHHTSPASAAAPTKTYGPTTRYDHLWRIALKTRPNHQVTVQQMVMALFQLNPQAFEADNVNALKRGAILRVPALSEIRRISNNQALTKIAHQNHAWPRDKAEIMLTQVDQHPQMNPQPMQQAASGDMADITVASEEAAHTPSPILATDEAALDNLQDNNPHITALGMQLNREIQHTRHVNKRMQKQLAHLEQGELTLNGELLKVNGELVTLTQRVAALSAVNHLPAIQHEINTQAATHSAAYQPAKRSFWSTLHQYLVTDVDLMQQRMAPGRFLGVVGFSSFALLALACFLGYALFYRANQRFSKEQPDNLMMETAGASLDDALSGDDQSDYDFMGSEEGIPTKFDLARAYIDMGDQSSAEQVLKEVMAQGDTDQRHQAQAFLKKLTTPQST